MSDLQRSHASFETVASRPPQDDEGCGLQQVRHGEEPGEARRPEPRTIVDLARSWLGTPYRHQASLRGVGCDCLGLVRGLWRELYGREPEPVPPYRPDWAETGEVEALLVAARRWMKETPLTRIAAGDVLMFRMEPGALVKHCAVVSALPSGADPQPRMIHAYWGRAVAESWLGPWWRRRLAAAFRFPEAPPWPR